MELLETLISWEPCLIDVLGFSQLYDAWHQLSMIVDALRTLVLPGSVRNFRVLKLDHFCNTNCYRWWKGVVESNITPFIWSGGLLLSAKAGLRLRIARYGLRQLKEVLRWQAHQLKWQTFEMQTMILKKSTKNNAQSNFPIL